MSGVHLDLFQKISGHEAKAWVTACLKARGIELEDAEVVSLIDSCRPEDFKNPRRPRVSKKVSSSSSERSEADYEPTRCDARVWLKGGFAGQCSCKKAGYGRLCKRHQSEADKNDGAVKNGFFNEDRPDYHYGDESKSFIPWHDSTVCKPVKDTSSSTDKPKKPRICSLCKCAGHTKRTCPTLKPVEAAPAAEPEPAPEPAAEPAAEPETAAEPEAEPEAEPAPEDLSDDEGEPIESSHDALHMCIAGAAADEGAEPELDEDVSDDEVDNETIDCTYEGVAYTRNSKGEVFDDDFELAGSWVDGAIKFSPEGAANHLSNPDRS